MDTSFGTPTRSQIRAELLRLVGDALGEDVSAVPGDLPLSDFLVSSMALVEGMRRIYDRYGVLVSIRRVLEGQATLDGVAAYIEQELKAPRAQREAPGDALSATGA